MPETTVASEFHKSLYVHRNPGAKLSFNFVLAINNLADSRDLVFSQIICLRVKVYTGLMQYLPGCATPNSINIGQTYLDPFIPWQINACNPCQIFSLPVVCYSLLVIR